MLRIRFTDRDLARVRVADGVDPLWETVLATHQLSSAARGGERAYGTWRRQARAELADQRLRGTLRALHTLAPPRADYFPDFLTPEGSAGGLAAGLDALCGTPRDRLAAEMTRTFAGRPVVAPWCRDLARGDRDRLADLAEGVGRLYHAVVAPGWSATESLVEADRAVRARALRDGGVHGLLASFAPTMRWQPPTLLVPYCESRELSLGGRGLRLVPSRFCWRMPVALGDPGLPQVLVYPALAGTAGGAGGMGGMGGLGRTGGAGGTGGAGVSGGARPGGAVGAAGPGGAADGSGPAGTAWSGAAGRGTAGRAGAADAPGCDRRLTALLGRTRARVLVALGNCGTTGELAVRLDVSAPTASAHVTALRDAGLVLSHRTDGRVLHTLTPLGAALLRGHV
ncbi:helix-turn-helix domain-containing protein [Actinacidiphila sp. DG2A-62]|uniref:helix-turn-helix domain-containing protein n=1 Tax=Actinacidiphila sp. DG2A-62 TaxID=3108821 RepID=UPI002DB5635C|nr:helix-turn-helix domain-containing protein [Actinacidiphila sp. DG2A-62]MEC3996993.1 helix-turn-helix domain-containing protein [Actinacidiphila sp. DG2A-62]